MSTAVETGGGKEIELAMALLLQAREKLAVAQSHLRDGHFLFQAMAVEAAQEQLVEAMAEVGGS